MFEQLVEDFQANMFVRRRSPGTVKGYSWALYGLVQHLDAQGIAHPSEVTFEDIESWQKELAKRVSPGSQRLAATAVRMFLKWAIRRRSGFAPYLAEFVVDVEAPRADPRPIEPEHLERILAYYRPRRPRASIAHLRNRALFCYLLETGARVSEALQVTKTEAKRAIVWQKGGSEKVLEIGPAAAAMIEDYLTARDDDCPWLWITHEAGDEYGPRRLSADGVREIWKPLCRKLGIPRFTTHQVRHTAATELLNADIDHLVVANHLGHRDLSTIKRYAKVRERQRQEARDVLERVIRMVDQAPERPRLLPPLRKAGRY